MKFTYLLAYGLIRFLGILPFRLLYALGYVLGLCYWQLGKRDRKIALANIRLCYPELSEQEQYLRARASIIHTAINVTETAWIWAHRYPAIKKKIVQIDGHELVEQAEAADSGTVFLLAHFGQWDIFGHYFGQHCDNPVYLGREFGIPIFDNYIKRGRELSGGTIFPCTREGLGQLYAATADGRATGILADQEPNKKNGLFAPLFGQQALTTLLTQDLVQKTGSRVVMTACKRLPKGRGFHIRFFEVDAEIYSPDMPTATAAMNRSYEQLINWQAEQYTWNYKRFKTRPEGEENIYRKRKKSR